MRKFLALALVALLALTMAFAVVGCAQQEQAAPESSPMSEPMMQDTSSLMSDTAMTDTSSMQH